MRQIGPALLYLVQTPPTIYYDLAQYHSMSGPVTDAFCELCDQVWGMLSIEVEGKLSETSRAIWHGHDIQAGIQWIYLVIKEIGYFECCPAYLVSHMWPWYWSYHG